MGQVDERESFWPTQSRTISERKSRELFLPSSPSSQGIPFYSSVSLSESFLPRGVSRHRAFVWGHLSFVHDVERKLRAKSRRTGVKRPGKKRNQRVEKKRGNRPLLYLSWPFLCYYFLLSPSSTLVCLGLDEKEHCHPGKRTIAG